MTNADLALFSALGFNWNRTAIPSGMSTHSVERVAFRLHKMLDQFVWEASMLVGNPFIFSEVKTLLDGVTVGGRRISDQAQILNLIGSTKHLLALVKAGEFRVDKVTFAELHGRVVRNETRECNFFQREGIETQHRLDGGLGERGRFLPPTTAAGARDLNRVFDQGLQALQSEVPQPFEKAVAFFLFGALQQFFRDANSRTSHLMLNGILMSAGIDAISIPADKADRFKECMSRFYRYKEGTDMMNLLSSCHPDVLG